MSRILFAQTYPFTPGKVDAIALLSVAKIHLPSEVVLLPPFPTSDMIGEENDYYRTANVSDDEIPEGVTATEISPESFLSLKSPNPNQPVIPSSSEIQNTMPKDKFLNSKPWSNNLFTGEKGDDDDEE